LCAAAGYANVFPVSVFFTTYGPSILVDQAQLMLKYLKDVRIEAKLAQKEYGAYAASCLVGNFDSMTVGPQTTFIEPDNYLNQYMPGEAKNQSHVNDPVAADLIVRQRRTFDTAKRRELINDIRSR